MTTPGGLEKMPPSLHRVSLKKSSGGEFLKQFIETYRCFYLHIILSLLSMVSRFHDFGLYVSINCFKVSKKICKKD